MEKTKMIKLFLVLLVSLMVILSGASVLAATELDLNSSNGIEDLTVNENTESDNTSNTENTNSNSANTNTNSANVNSALNSSNNTNTTNSNSSSYNNNTNTSLPATGSENTGLMLVAIVALAISAVYAFKKIRDYKNV